MKISENVVFHYLYYIYSINNNLIMKEKIRRKKIGISITLPQDIIEMIKENNDNVSKYLEYCIIKEMCNDNFFKEELRKRKIII